MDGEVDPGSAPMRFGIVGPGEIASVFAESLRETGIGIVHSAHGRDRDRLHAFCGNNECRPRESLDALLEDPRLDAVYVATPHSAHAEVVRRALERGRPVLCEKPLTTSAATTRDLWQLAEDTGTPLFEAWMYRCQPQIDWLLDILRSEVLGAPLRLEASFSFAVPFDGSHRLFDPALGGGGILDVGGYPVSLALLIDRAARAGRNDPRSVSVRAPTLERVEGVLSESGVDQHAEAHLSFDAEPDPFTAEIAVSLDRHAERKATLTCENGIVVLSDPYLPGGERRGKLADLAFVLAGSLPETKVLNAELDPFAAEAKAFRDWIRRTPGEPVGTAPWPMVDREESILLAQILETWRTAFGLRVRR